MSVSILMFCAEFWDLGLKFKFFVFQMVVPLGLHPNPVHPATVPWPDQILHSKHTLAPLLMRHGIVSMGPRVSQSKLQIQSYTTASKYTVISMKYILCCEDCNCTSYYSKSLLISLRHPFCFFVVVYIFWILQSTLDNFRLLWLISECSRYHLRVIKLIWDHFK